jgi:hypothetical protein
MSDRCDVSRGEATSRVFLLSPANCSGRRAHLLLSPSAGFELAARLRSPEGAPLGEVFAFISQLYFRGKLAYARAFARPPAGPAEPRLGDGVLVITPSRGVLAWDARVDAAAIAEFAAVEVHHANRAYAAALEQGARAIAERLDGADEVVLLGSIASEKYAAVLVGVFGARLVFPREFVGRGDMSRGGLLLRSVRTCRQLDYIPLAGSPRHGVRPPRLPPS